MSNSAFENSLYNHSSIFFAIKKKTNDVLKPYDNKNFLNDPSVDIKAITDQFGIKVLYVDPKEVDYKYSVLIYTQEGPVIKVNNKTSPEEQRFSIAHELEHFFKSKAKMHERRKNLKKIGIIQKKENISKIKIQFARSAANTTKGDIRKIIPKLLFHGILSKLSKIASEIFGKKVSIKKTLDALESMLPSSKTYNYLISNSFNKLYNEEMADYFAANLLVPTERFILWENKTDREIAKNFNVPIGCIKKRRKEIAFERDLLTSDVREVRKALASLDKSDTTVEGFDNYESAEG